MTVSVEEMSYDFAFGILLVITKMGLVPVKETQNFLQRLYSIMFLNYRHHMWHPPCT